MVSAGPRPDAKEAKCAEPKLICEVEFTTWTRDGRVRHPAFKGLREDKPANSVDDQQLYVEGLQHGESYANKLSEGLP